MEKILEKFSIKQKIILLVLVAAVLISVSSIFLTVANIRSTLTAENKTKITNIVETAASILKLYSEKVENNQISLEEAQKKAIEEINAINFDGSNYLWITNYDYLYLAHPKKQGDSGAELTDKNGVKIIVEGTKVATEKGAGFVTYYWPKPGQSEAKVYPKLSYFVDFPKWKWVIGTGIYIDQINNSVLNATLQIVLASIAVVSIILIVMIFTIIKNIVSTIEGIVGDINSSSEEISQASSELETASEKMAESSTEQASAIQETSSTLEETSSMVQQNRDNTKQAAILAKQSKESAAKSNEEMQRMMVSMEDLKKSSNEIAKIIKVIDEIAFQTNILSLNAAVEAARAGDAGKGFSVVAEEVRNLAQRSANAAKETASIIESNIILSENSAEMAKNVNVSLEEIDNESKKVSGLLDEILIATEEQTQGVSQINKAISQMEIVLGSNAQIAEESSASAKNLHKQTLNMTDIINRLTTFVEGDKYN